MKYFIIAGEASGDLHGSNLIKQLRLSDKKAKISCWGGDLMKNEGAELLKHYRELAFMGAWEVIINARKIFKNLRQVKQQISDFKPDVVILVDYPGFNLRIAEYLKGRGMKVYYYISPKVWAWKKKRVYKIKRYIDRMYIIFPFETEFYKQYDYNVQYFGNPLVEAVEDGLSLVPERDEFLSRCNIGDKPIIALLAGSRVQEIKKILPVMVAVSAYYIDYQFVVAGLSSISQAIYDKYLKSSSVRVIFDQTYGLLKYSDAALVTSGTATLETALADIPQVVCYKTSWLTFSLAKLFVKIRYISLVNLIMDKEIVKELIQDDLSERKVVEELNSLLPGGWKRSVMKTDYLQLRRDLAGTGSSARIAEDIYHSLILVSNVN